MPTKDLYLLQGAMTIVRIGSPINRVTNDDNKFPPFTFPKATSTQAALDVINALLTSKAIAQWTFGDDDGVTAPTVLGASFDRPAGRSWLPFPARVSNITERLTETGPQITVHFEVRPAA
ncbi:hypothetical protein [Ferribacterium limneticum]|uniref:hypothetical protein n=1 Tax=Ferribacterium limneticum TaxID=76259 RepID=UPI001CFB32CC|nr:hypothetical protein [Ferribacterium limneticum]UCV27006.1 hypothetical protein KI617_11920 [Ferribacterium limneticum]UCV30923.1 hypothetical protein KI608_11920 [Ferribacterium limneticum]